jgi:hypothetical protein
MRSEDAKRLGAADAESDAMESRRLEKEPPTR